MSDGVLIDELTRRLRTLQALKAGALRLFDPMLAGVAAARASHDLIEVHDLLGRMHGAFGDHRDQTAGHAGRLADRLRDLGARPSRPLTAGVGTGAALRAKVAVRGGMNFGALASEAFVFEHAEIAQAQLIQQLAERTGDRPTADLIASIRDDDEAMAATIGRNWVNVCTLMLATKGLPTRRPAEAAA